MAKQIILYNLAEHVTDEQYKDYVVNEKGPLLDGLPGVKKFELVKITGSMQGEIPFKYIGIRCLGPAEILGIDSTVGIEPFRKPHDHFGPCLAGYFELGPSGYVLSQIEYI